MAEDGERRMRRPPRSGLALLQDEAARLEGTRAQAEHRD